VVTVDLKRKNNFEKEETSGWYKTAVAK